MISESSVADLVKSVTSDPAVKSLQERMVAVEKALQTLIYMGAAALVFLALLLWR